MLEIEFNCAPDLSGIPTDYALHADGKCFPAHKFILMTRSNYFKRAFMGGFNEKNSNEMTLTDVDPEVFNWVLKTLYQESFIIVEFEECMEYMLMLDYFQVGGINLEELLRQLDVPDTFFEKYIQYLDILYPGGFTEEVIEIVASKVICGTDISKLFPELQKAVRAYRNDSTSSDSDCSSSSDSDDSSSCRRFGVKPKYSKEKGICFDVQIPTDCRVVSKKPKGQCISFDVPIHSACNVKPKPKKKSDCCEKKPKKKESNCCKKKY